MLSPYTDSMLSFCYVQRDASKSCVAYDLFSE